MLMLSMLRTATDYLFMYSIGSVKVKWECEDMFFIADLVITFVLLHAGGISAIEQQRSLF